MHRTAETSSSPLPATKIEHASVENTPAAASTPIRAYLVIGMALIAASFAAVTTRLAQDNGLPSPLIAAGRMSLAFLILSPLVLRRYRSQLRHLNLSDLRWTMAAGLFLAVHFNFLNFALENSTVLVVQVIVNTGPLWVAMLETTFLGARLPRMVYFALMITLVGGLVIAGASASGAVHGMARLQGAGGIAPIFPTESAPDPLLGAGLALMGSIAGAIYMTIGRKVRAKVALIPYVWLLYGTGGIIGLLFVLFTGTPVTGHPTAGYLWLLVITVGPQLIGHSGFNYALGFFSATFVSISTQTLSISAAVIAFFLFAEVPLVLEVVGSAIIGIGVVLAIIAQRKD